MVEQVLSSAYPDGALAPSVSQPNAATSWRAIIAGAFVATAISLILLALGSARPLPKPQSIWLSHSWSVRSSLVWLPRWAEDCATNILKAASQ
jgi:hypothetical protein